MHEFFSSDNIWLPLFEIEFGQMRKDDLFDFVTVEENNRGKLYKIRFMNEFLRECPLQSGTKCARCKNLYHESQNNDTACLYHHGNLTIENTVSYSCCTTTTSNGSVIGKNFWIVGDPCRYSVTKILVNYLWKIWLNDEDAVAYAKKYQGVNSRPGMVLSGTVVWHPHHTYSPKIDELHRVSIMLVFDLNDASTLDVLKKYKTNGNNRSGFVLIPTYPFSLE